MRLRLFGDLHYSKNYLQLADFEAKRDIYFAKFFEKLFEVEADYYISLGDLTNTGDLCEWQGVYDLLRKHQAVDHFLLTVGNHDAYSLTKAQLEEFLAQPLYRAIEVDDYLLIFLDTSREKDFFDWSGYLDQDQLTWLENLLNNHRDKHLIVFGHHPLYNTTLFSNTEKASVVPQVGLKEILDQHLKPSLYLCGHVHADSIVHEGQWTYIQLAAVLDQPCVRELEISDGQVSISSYNLDETDRQKGTWLGANMAYFNLVDRGFQGLHNRDLEFDWEDIIY